VDGQAANAISWTDTRIIAYLPSKGGSAESNTVTVNAVFCNASASFRISH
jgi:hypothetical protein